MNDYTPEGIMCRQMDIAVATLHLIDKKLNKINTKLTLLTLLGAAVIVVKRKDIIKLVEKMKGE